MHIGLTDHVLCPRCEGEQGLILLIQETTEDGRVWRGWLGCPRCGSDYPVEAGAADLRGDRSAPPSKPEPYQAEELPVRIAALVGVTEGPGFVYLGPALAPCADRVADAVQGIEWVAAGGWALGQREAPGVSRIVFDGPRWPFASGRLRGAALVRPEATELREAARTLWPGSRVVAFDPGESTVAGLADTGLVILACDETAVVATKLG